MVARSDEPHSPKSAHLLAETLLAAARTLNEQKITEDQAFTLLTRASQTTNVKLGDIAAELLRIGTLPSRH
jgi:AmiR/NasT family two-component response regulator